MDIINKYIDNSNFNYIGPVIFLAILAIGFSFGILNGRKTSIYFLIGNFSALVIGVIVISFAVGKLTDIPAFEELSIGDITLNEMLDKNISSIRSLLGVVLIPIFMMIISFIMFIIYWFIRGNMKSLIRKNKTNNTSNLGIRLQGGLISLLSALPFAVFLSSIGFATGNASGFESFNNKISFAMTFGKVTDVASTMRSAVNIINYSETLSSIGGSLGSIFGVEHQDNGKMSIDEILSNPKNREAIQYLLNNNLAINNTDIIVDMIPQDQLTEIDLTNGNGVIPDSSTLSDGNLAITISDDKLNDLAENLNKSLIKAGAKSSVEGIINFLRNSKITIK